MRAKDFLEEFHKKSSETIQENFNILLGEEVKISGEKWQNSFVNEFFTINQLPVASCKISATKGYNGEAFLLFPKKDAILFGGVLAMFGDAVLEEKITSLELGKAEYDAFHETCNQLIGLIDQVFHELLPEKIHLKQLDTKVLENENEQKDFFEKIYSEESIISFPYQVKLKNKYDAEFNIAFPISFVSQFVDLKSIEASEETNQGQIKNENSKTHASNRIGRALVIDLDQDETNEFTQLFEEENINFDFINTISQLKIIIEKNSVKLIVIQANNNFKKGLEICGKLSKYLENSLIPIWMQGNNWDMVLIEKALQVGAWYLVVSPIDRNILSSRLHQVFA
jgi:chemotaxis protein CheY-P-specific phosphatase CheC